MHEIPEDIYYTAALTFYRNITWRGGDSLVRISTALSKREHFRAAVRSAYEAGYNYGHTVTTKDNQKIGLKQ